MARKYQENKQIQEERDREIEEFIDKFKIATTNTIKELFFSNKSLRFAQRRLSRLVGYGVLNRSRDHFTFQYMYYKKKPQQLRHRLILTDFYREIVKLGFNIVKFENEFSFFPELRPDGFVAYEFEGIKKLMFVEVEKSNNKLNIKKYIDFYESENWKNVGFPEFPDLIVVTNKVKRFNVNEFKLIKIKEDMSDIKNIKGDII